MGTLRVLVPVVFAGFLVGCAAHIPVLETQDDVLTTTAQPDPTPTGTVKSESKKIPPKPAAASTTRHADPISPTSLTVGSPQKWEKERAEEERKEQQLKQVIEGICRGC